MSDTFKKIEDNNELISDNRRDIAKLESEIKTLQSRIKKIQKTNQDILTAETKIYELAYKCPEWPLRHKKLGPKTMYISVCALNQNRAKELAEMYIEQIIKSKGYTYINTEARDYDGMYDVIEREAA
jgi:hypothetical protein